MPQISTHLNLALRFVSRVQLNSPESFLLGGAYPDCFHESVEEALCRHFKQDADGDCDIDEFLKNSGKNDFDLGYLFHLWVDNRIKTVDLKDVRKSDCLICDMERVGVVFQKLKDRSFSGKENEAMKNILTLERTPMLLYIVPDDIKAQYESILDDIAEEFIREYKSTQNT